MRKMSERKKVLLGLGIMAMVIAAFFSGFGFGYQNGWSRHEQLVVQANNNLPYTALVVHVIDRENGTGVAGVNLTFRISRGNEIVQTYYLVTDSEGYVVFRVPHEYFAYRWEHTYLLMVYSAQEPAKHEIFVVHTDWSGIADRTLIW